MCRSHRNRGDQLAGRDFSWCYWTAPGTRSGSAGSLRFPSKTEIRRRRRQGPVDLSEATAQPGDVRQGMIYFGQSGKATGTKIESQIAVFADITDAEQITEALNGLTISNWSLARICKAQDGCLAAGLVILPFAYPAAAEDYTNTKTKRESGVDYILLSMFTDWRKTVWIDGVVCSSSNVDGERNSTASVKAAEPHMMVVRRGAGETSLAVATFLILPYLSGEQS